MRANSFCLFITIDPLDNEGTGEDLEHLPVDDLNQDFDIDVAASDMDSEDDQ